MTVSSSTISGNSTSRDGGGIRASGDVTATIENSIVAGNTDDSTAPDLRPGTGALTVRYSLIGDNTGTGLAEAPVGAPDANGNLIGDPGGMGAIDPHLAPLADNDGTTQTHALLLGSPAIDAGDSNFAPPPDFDQRGNPFSRVFGSRIDMGAYERQAGDMDFDGDVDFDDIDAVVLGLRQPDDYEVLYGAPASANGDTDGDGDLDFDDIPGFVDLLNPGLSTSTLSTETRSFDTIDLAHDRADVMLSTDPRQDVSSGSNLARPRLLPILKKRASSSRFRSASATRSRELRDNELAAIWSGDLDWLRSVDRDRFGVTVRGLGSSSLFGRLAFSAGRTSKCEKCA